MTAPLPSNYHLLPDAEELETRLRNMYGHLNDYVRKKLKQDGQDTNYALRKKVTRTFHRRRSI